MQPHQTRAHTSIHCYAQTCPCFSSDNGEADKVKSEWHDRACKSECSCLLHYKVFLLQAVGAALLRPGSLLLESEVPYFRSPTVAASSDSMHLHQELFFALRLLPS